MRSLLSLLMAAVVAAGCTGAKTAATANAGEHLQRLRAGYRSTPELHVEGDLKITGVPATVWFESMIRNRDSLKILLNGPFGITLGAMSATPRYFQFYNPEEDIVFEGEPTRETFQKLIMVGLDYGDLSALLRGEIPRVPNEGEYTVESRESQLLYSVRTGNVLEQFTLDPAAAVVTSYRSAVVGSDTVPELDVTFDSFIKVGERQFPRKAQVDIAGGAQRMRVNVERVASSLPDDEALSITIPEGVTRKRL